MNFTFNNHLTYSIGDRLFGNRDTPHEKFKVNVGKIDLDYYKTSNWLEEQYRTAELISKEYGKDFWKKVEKIKDTIVIKIIEMIIRSFGK